MGHTCLIALIYLFGNVSQYKCMLLSSSKFEFNVRQYYFLLTLTTSFDPLEETLFKILTYTVYIVSNRNIRFWLIVVNLETYNYRFFYCCTVNPPTEKLHDFILLMTQCCQVNLGS